MPSRRVYWDACCFLSYLNGDADRRPVLDALLESARREEIAIVTSVASLTEVAYGSPEKETRQLDERVEEAIDALFADHAVTLIGYHERVARDARHLIRKALVRGWSLKPMDAIHLASAVSVGAEAIHTYDDEWPKYAPVLEIPIGSPAGVTPRLGLPD